MCTEPGLAGAIEPQPAAAVEAEPAAAAAVPAPDGVHQAAPGLHNHVVCH